MPLKGYICFGIYFYKSMKFYVETRSLTTYIKGFLVPLRMMDQFLCCYCRADLVSGLQDGSSESNSIVAIL